MDWKALLSLDLKSAVIGAGLALAIAGTPTYFEYEGLKLQLNGARNVALAQAQGVAMAEAKREGLNGLVPSASGSHGPD